MTSIFSDYDGRYLYPPRPEVAIPPQMLEKYETGEWFAQPKYNGSCATLILEPGGSYSLYNRHNEALTLQRPLEYSHLNPHPNRYMVLTGEYLNKNQLGEGGIILNHAFVIWDLLVMDGVYLLGSTNQQRQALLQNMYGTTRGVVKGAGKDQGKLVMCNHLYAVKTDKVLDGIYRAPNYIKGFTDSYNEIQNTPLYEGLVIKRCEGKLENGNKSANNTLWQVKCRRTHKNYKF